MSPNLEVVDPNGIRFRNGIGVASSPATQTPNQWRELWKYGAGFIVLKTASDGTDSTVSDHPGHQTRVNVYEQNGLPTLENIGRTTREQKPIFEILKEIKEAWNDGIFVIPSIASKNPDMSSWRSMIDAVASTGVPYFESTLRYPYRGIMRQVVDELRETYGGFDFDFNEYHVGITPPFICQKSGLGFRYVEEETNRRFEHFLRSVGEYSTKKGIGMIAKLWSGRHDMPALIALCALSGMKGITLINSYQSPPIREFEDMQTYKRANVSGGDLRRLRNAALEVGKRTLQDDTFPKVTLFASGGVAVEMTSRKKGSLEHAMDDVSLCRELGADLVQLYTAIHSDYTLLGQLVHGIGRRLEKDGKSFADLGKVTSQLTGQNIPIYRLYQIDPDSCIGCGLCAVTAYCDAIRLSDAPTKDKRQTYEIHPNDCTGCGLCTAVCPIDNTIKPLYPEDGNKVLA